MKKEIRIGGRRGNKALRKQRTESEQLQRYIIQ
jgi:hypothetical protein